MDIQFSLHGSPLLYSEAEALIQTSTKIKKPLNIDITDYVSVDELNSSKLFDLAVKTKNQELASLAFKISVSRDKTVKKQEPKNTIVNIIPYKEKTKSIEDIIDDINMSSSYPMIGAAMIMKMLSTKEESTLRETAIFFANLMWNDSTVAKNSKFFKGFEYKEGALVPLLLRDGVERKHTFHVAPIYLGLREGLAYCVEKDLVRSRRRLSTGSPYRETAPNAEQMQRVYYSFKATEKGKNLYETWADIDNYIRINFHNQRQAS